MTGVACPDMPSSDPLNDPSIMRLLEIKADKLKKK
jgi:hypothetical protein